MIILDMPLLRDDVGFISKQLSNLTQFDRYRLIRQYEVDFYTAFDAEHIEHRKDNAGRRHANTKLREEVERMKDTQTKGGDEYRCCDNCEHIGEGNTCLKFGEKVPDEYLTETTECNFWQDGVPF